MTRRWMIRRYDHRLESMADAAHHEFDAIEELPCPDLVGCIAEISNMMYVAACVETTSDFAYALWVDDDGEAMPVYVLMREHDESPHLTALATPDVEAMFEEHVYGWGDLLVRKEAVGWYGDGPIQECDSP